MCCCCVVSLLCTDCGRVTFIPAQTLPKDVLTVNGMQRMVDDVEELREHILPSSRRDTAHIPLEDRASGAVALIGECGDAAAFAEAVRLRSGRNGGAVTVLHVAPATLPQSAASLSSVDMARRFRAGMLLRYVKTYMLHVPGVDEL